MNIGFKYSHVNNIFAGCFGYISEPDFKQFITIITSNLNPIIAPINHLSITYDPETLYNIKRDMTELCMTEVLYGTLNMISYNYYGHTNNKIEKRIYKHVECPCEEKEQCEYYCFLYDGNKHIHIEKHKKVVIINKTVEIEKTTNDIAVELITLLIHDNTKRVSEIVSITNKLFYFVKWFYDDNQFILHYKSLYFLPSYTSESEKIKKYIDERLIDLEEKLDLNSYIL